MKSLEGQGGALVGLRWRCGLGRLEQSLCEDNGRTRGEETPSRARRVECQGTAGDSEVLVGARATIDQCDPSKTRPVKPEG